MDDFLGMQVSTEDSLRTFQKLLGHCVEYLKRIHLLCSMKLVLRHFRKLRPD